MSLLKDRLKRRAVNSQSWLQQHLQEKQITKFQAKSVQRGRNSGEAREERLEGEKPVRSRAKCFGELLDLESINLEKGCQYKSEVPKGKDGVKRCLQVQTCLEAFLGETTRTGVGIFSQGGAHTTRIRITGGQLYKNAGFWASLWNH